MGKKVSWFSAIKKAFTPNSKQKLANENEAEKKNSKKWGLGKIKHGATPSFIYRKPSSIEKILGDAEKEQQHIQPVASYDGRRTPPIPTRSFDERRTPPIPTRSFDERRTPPIPTRSYNHNTEVNYTRNTPKNPQDSAIKIQAAYRGYTARRNIRALKGMVRLQGVVRGQNVKRQTINAMKQMQLLTKVQSQIQLRRINLLEKQVLQNQNIHKNDGELESSYGRWSLSQPSEIGQSDEWDDSLLTKEELDARMQKKVEALMKRERILAYANSHQWFKAGSTPMELRSGALPWWWIRIEQQLPQHSPIPPISKNKLMHPSLSLEPSPRSQSKQSRFGAENLNSLTPRSSKSPMATTTSRTKLFEPILSNRVQQSNTSIPVKRADPRSNENDFAFSLPLRDDDSFTSCPPRSRPNYMTPTVSTKAKLKAYNNLTLNDRSPATLTPGQKNRFSLPLTQSFGSLRWKRASSIFSNNDSSSSQRKQGNNYRSAMSIQSMGNSSVDSTTSMPAALGRKPFNRFV